MGAQMVYLPKPVTRKENEDGGDLSSDGVRYGVTGMQGWRRSMEDSHLAVTQLDDKISLFGVFDGHGGRGVSRYAAKRLPALIRDSEAYKQGDYARALERAFLAVDERLREDAGRREVEELDAPDPDGPPAQPMAVPRRVLQRFLGRGAGGGGGREEEEEVDLATPPPSEEEEEEQQKAASGEGGPAPAAAAAEKKEEGSGKESSEKTSTEPPAEKPAAEEAAAPAKGGDKGGDKADNPAEKVTPNGNSGAKAEKPAEGNEDMEDPELDDEGDELVVQLADEVAIEGEGEEGEEEMEVDGFLDDEADCNGEDMALVDPSRLTRDPTPEAQGCTAVVVLVVRGEGGDGPRLICANAGDSRAILSRGGEVVALSEDHKPENDSETARITKAGGFVQHMPGGARVQGDLNLSRAMGDLRYKKPQHLPPEEQILTAFPEVRTFALKEEDEFMVLGCDGIWERTQNQEMVDYVRPRLAAAIAEPNGKAGALSQICNEICDKGLCPSMSPQENPDFDGTGCDNMTVVVVQLKPRLPADADAAAGGSAAKRAAEAKAEDSGGAAKKSKTEEAAA